MGKYFKDPQPVRTSKYFKDGESNVRLAQANLLLSLFERAPQIFKGLTQGWRTVKDLAKYAPKVITSLEEAAVSLAKPYQATHAAFESEIRTIDTLLLKTSPGSSTEASLLLKRQGYVDALNKNALDANKALDDALREFNAKDQLKLGGDVKWQGGKTDFLNPKLEQNLEALGQGKTDIKNLERIKERVFAPSAASGASKFQVFKGSIESLVNPLKTDAQIKNLLSRPVKVKNLNLPLPPKGGHPDIVLTLEQVIKDPAIMDQLTFTDPAELATLQRNYQAFLDRAEALEKGISLANPMVRSTGKILGRGLAAGAAGSYYLYPKGAEGLKYLTDEKAAKEKTREENKETKDYFGYDSKDMLPEQRGSQEESSSYTSPEVQKQAQFVQQIQSQLNAAQDSGNSTLVSFWQNQLNSAGNQLNQMAPSGGAYSRNYFSEKPLMSGHYDTEPGGWDSPTPKQEMTQEQKAFQDLQNLRRQLL